MKRLFIVLIKYIPIIQMVGMLFNNILYCFSDIYIISYILDFIIGNSITTTFLLYVCSYVFGFCKWHRFIITANIINLLIANLDAYYRIPNVFSGVEIGGGTIKINIPSFDKQLVFDYNDIETFKQNILN